VDIVRAVELCAGQGVASWRTLVDAGLSSSGLRAAAQAGRVSCVARGLYTVAADPDRLAVASHIGVLSHRTAAVVLGMDLIEEPAGIEVTVADRRRRPPEPVTCHRARLSPVEVQMVGALRVTSPMRTIVDLSRRLPRHEAMVAADSALRSGLVSMADLQEHAAGARGPGSGRVQAVARGIDSASESALETLLRVLMHDAGLCPRSQVRIGDATGTVARVDFLFPAERVVVEADGFAFHSSRESLRNDVRRANALQEMGYRILRFTWQDVVGRPGYVVATIRRTLVAASS
jgi:very-short-patch-repair endonuclease